MPNPESQQQQQPEPSRGTSRSTFDTVIKQDSPFAQATNRDPWPGTLAALRQCTSPSRAGRDTPYHGGTAPFPRPASCDPSLGRFEARTYSVRVLERLPNLTIAVAWRDPTLCNYTNQVWALTEASRGGRCALSGKPVRRGVEIYSPQAGKHDKPLNVNAMILASALPVIAIDDG